MQRNLGGAGVALASVAAVCLLIAVTAVVVAVRAQDGANGTVPASTEVSQVLGATDAEKTNAPVRTGGTGTIVSSRSEGKAVVTLAGVARLPESQTYEAWFMGEGDPRPAGLLSSGQAVVATGLGEATQIGLTVEPKGGSPKPTTNPIFAVDLPA